MQPPANPSPRTFEGFPARSSFYGKRGARIFRSKCMVTRWNVTSCTALRFTRPRPTRGRTERSVEPLASGPQSERTHSSEDSRSHVAGQGERLRRPRLWPAHLPPLFPGGVVSVPCPEGLRRPRRQSAAQLGFRLPISADVWALPRAESAPIRVPPLRRARDCGHGGVQEVRPQDPPDRTWLGRLVRIMGLTDWVSLPDVRGCGGRILSGGTSTPARPRPAPPQVGPIATGS